MRVLFLGVALLVTVGCGAEERSGGGPPGSTSPPGESGPSLPFDEAEVTKPPPIVLESAAGRQHAALGSSCVDFVDEASGQGVGVCSDTVDPSPDEMSVVRPGEEIAISLEHASVVRADGCVGDDEQDCIGGVIVEPLGCEGERVRDVLLAPGSETRWRVDLPPGRYELDVFGYFEAPDGRSGDVSGALGLVVDETQRQELLPAPEALAGC